MPQSYASQVKPLTYSIEPLPGVILSQVFVRKGSRILPVYAGMGPQDGGLEGSRLEKEQKKRICKGVLVELFVGRGDSKITLQIMIPC